MTANSPPLRIKLGLMRQVTIRLVEKNKDAFVFLCEFFYDLTPYKIKNGEFTGPHIHKLMDHQPFENYLNFEQNEAWQSFKDVVDNYLGNHKSDQFHQMVERLLIDYRQMGCLMSIKVHFLMCHLDFFPDNLGDFSDKRTNASSLRSFEINFKSNWDINVLCDYMWFTLKECDEPRPRNDNERRYFVLSFSQFFTKPGV